MTITRIFTDYSGRAVEQVQMIGGVEVSANVVFMQKRRALPQPRRARCKRSLQRVLKFRPVESLSVR